MKVRQTRTISVEWIPSIKYALINTHVNRVLAVCASKEDAEYLKERHATNLYGVKNTENYQILEAIEE